MLRKSMAIRRATLNYSRLGAPCQGWNALWILTLRRGGGSREEDGETIISVRDDFRGIAAQGGILEQRPTGPGNF